MNKTKSSVYTKTYSLLITFTSKALIPFHYPALESWVNLLWPTSFTTSTLSHKVTWFFTVVISLSILLSILPDTAARQFGASSEFLSITWYLPCAPLYCYLFYINACLVNYYKPHAEKQQFFLYLWIHVPTFNKSMLKVHFLDNQRIPAWGYSESEIWIRISLSSLTLSSLTN